MKPRYSFILDHSLNMVLSAIEIYNKPDFTGRVSKSSPILLVAAWEALLKAKIVNDNRNRLTALYVRSPVRAPRAATRRTGSGHYLTIDIDAAIAPLCLSPGPVAENLRHLVSVRDAAIHLTAESKSLP